MNIKNKLKSLGRTIKSYRRLGQVALPLLTAGVANSGAIMLNAGIKVDPSNAEGLEEVIGADLLFIPQNNVWVLGSGSIEHSEANDSTDVYGSLGVYGVLNAGDASILIGGRANGFADSYEKKSNCEIDVRILGNMYSDRARRIGIAGEIGFNGEPGELGDRWGIDAGLTLGLGPLISRMGASYKEYDGRNTGEMYGFFGVNIGPAEVGFKFEAIAGEQRLGVSAYLPIELPDMN